MNSRVYSLAASALIYLLASAVIASTHNEPVIALKSGAIKGSAANGVAAFRGIPYAAPPVGELRWRAPQSVKKWAGIRDATRNGHVCPQPLDRYGDWADSAIRQAGLSEDCLTLNVFTPAELPEDPLPVMFYIHGGNMQFGSAAIPLYSGEILATKGVVLVVINYRLGYFGRFGHPALTKLQADEPLVNYGLMDQIAALEWVRDNIAAFGGDPGNVTIFGHSAGGVSVNYLMTTSQSRGLFHKAIAQGSGVLIDRSLHAFVDTPRGLTGKSSETIGLELAAEFGITPQNTPDDMEVVRKLRQLPWADIIAYQKKVQRPFNPVIDGKLVADNLAEVFERGEQHDVPYIGGANSWEWNQIANLPLIGKWFLGGALLEGLSDEDLAIFDDAWTRIGLSQRWFSDGLFLTSTRYLAKQMANVNSPAWHFHVTYRQTAIRDQVPGAGHGVEMPGLFANLDEHPEYQRPAEAVEHAPSAEDLAWSDMVRSYWLNFAKTGNPNGRGLPEWPEYEPATDLTQELGVETGPRANLNKVTLDFLEQRALVRRQRLDAEYPIQ